MKYSILLIKLLRTAIGLPFVIVVWWAVVVFMIIGVAIEGVLWSFSNQFSESAMNDLARALTLPYCFIKEVWKK